MKNAIPKSTEREGMIMNKLLQNRGIGDILNAIAAAAGIIALICYLVSAEDKSGMTETYVSALVYVPLIIAILLNVVAFFLRNNIWKIGAFAVYFFAIATWCYNQGGYIVNVFMGIDGNVFSFAYVLTFICMLACAVLCVLAAVGFKKVRGKAEKQSGAAA